jgi:hypothetical protein
VFNHHSLPNSVKALYWVWAFSFPYDYRYLPLPKDPTGLSFFGFWVIWLGVGGLLAIPLGEWIANRKTS